MGGDTRSRRGWVVVSLLWLLFFFMAAYQMMPAAVLPLLMDGLGIGPSAASWIVSILFLAMAVMAIPSGIALDRFDIRVVIGAATVVVAAATVWSWHAGVAESYWGLLASRFLAGCGIVAVWTASVNGAGSVVSQERAATAIGLLSTSPLAGFAFALSVGPRIAALYGWPVTFPVVGLAALGVGGAFLALSAEVELGAEPDSRPTWNELEEVLANRHVWGIAVLGFVAFSITIFLNNWMPTYAVSEHSFSLAKAGWVSALISAAGIVSRGGSGFLSDALFERRRKPLVLISFVVLLPTVLAVTFAVNTSQLLFLLVLSGLASQLGLAILLPYVRELVSANVVGTALAVLNSASFLGAFSAPIITGALIEYSGGYATAFGYAGGIIAIAILVLRFVPEPA